MIRHPNFSGMQMNQVTRTYTPARYLDVIKVSHGDRTVFELSGDISLSTDPVIGFSYDPTGDAPLLVQATDSDGSRWQESFTPPMETN
jgi:sulfur-oxidizing protein SoxY